MRDFLKYDAGLQEWERNQGDMFEESEQSNAKRKSPKHDNSQLSKAIGERWEQKESMSTKVRPRVCL